jgi:2'-5' RNA ligase
MEAVSLAMPGYDVNEYMLVLAPHEELWHRIVKLREEFSDKYKAHGCRYTRPHILVASFSNRSMMEERIIQRLQQISMGLMPFKTELKDYGSFPSHSIFINVISKLPFQGLVRSIKEMQRLMKLNNEIKPHFIEEPYILIGRKLKPWQYEQAWLEYSNRQFTGRFIADHMLLLKRPTGSKTAFQILKRFEFQNLPVATKQGSFF